jgi:5-methylthioadenosine/S-adenosylhomocysteine deaminase
VRRAAQDAGEQVWGRVQEWDPLGRAAEQISPWSFPLAEGSP